jgi:hypothetical protein
MTAVFVEPARDAVSVTFCGESTLPTEAVKFATEFPAGTTTFAGTDSSEAFPLDRATVQPPAGAGELVRTARYASPLYFDQLGYVLSVTETPLCARKVAVYVVFTDGVAMVCVWAPASDHDANTYCCPPIVCGEGTPSALRIPTTPVNENDACTGCPSSVNCAPDGELASVMVTFRGWISRYVECVKPAESRTVR